MRHHRLSASIKAWLSERGWFNLTPELPKEVFYFTSRGIGMYFSMELVQEVFEYDLTHLREIPRHGLGSGEDGDVQYWDRLVHIPVEVDCCVELYSPERFQLADRRGWNAIGWFEERPYGWGAQDEQQLNERIKVTSEWMGERNRNSHSLKNLATQERLNTKRLERKQNGARV